MAKYEVNTLSPKDKRYKALIQACNELMAVDRQLIKKLIPENGIVRPYTCFKSLLIIAGNPKITNSSLTKKTSNWLVAKSTRRLLELNMITLIDKPRYIAPLKAYKIDKGFIITEHGMITLSAILPSIDYYSSLAQTA